MISLRTDWGTRYTDCRKIFALCPENLPQTAELSVDRDGDAFEVTGEAESGRFRASLLRCFSESLLADESGVACSAEGRRAVRAAVERDGAHGRAVGVHALPEALRCGGARLARGAVGAAVREGYAPSLTLSLAYAASVLRGVHITI